MNIVFTSRRISALLSLLILCVGIAVGQTAEVIHNVNLRSDPSTTNPPIRLPTPPVQVQLLEAGKTSGYYHVRTSVDEEGWVWGKNVQVLAVTPSPTPTTPAITTETPTPVVSVSLTTTPTPAGPATAIDPNWSKGTPVEITFTGASGTCGPDGQGDTETNHLKNRVDEPTSYHEVTWNAIKALPVPKVPTRRTNWKAAGLALVATQISPYEGFPLTVVSFGVRARSSWTRDSGSCTSQSAS